MIAKQRIAYKRSQQRERILEILRNTTEHPTANWLYDHLKQEFPNLSLGTIYRNLRILHEQGKISILDFGSTFDRFDARLDTHYQFICESCGKVCDVDLPVMETLEKKASENLGATIHRHRIEFYGTCAECSYKKEDGK
ncbi:MAG TPA: transcriptional repressor [Spirochaetales bacterium]|nr:transcriptional repressor [Spirochaetales bacterium]